MKVVNKSGKFMFLSDYLSGMSDPATREEDESLNLQVTSIDHDGTLY